MLQYLISHMSYGVIVLVLVITGSGIPVPEEVVVILAAVASRADQLEPWAAFASCVVGSLGGDCLMYLIGYHFGHSVIRDHPLISRHLNQEREQAIERMINQYGFRVYFLARFLVGIRSPVFLTAGILRIPFRRFMLVDMISATSVISLFFGLGYYFAENIMSWLKWIRRAEVALSLTVAIGVAALVIYVWRRRKNRWQRVMTRRRARRARNGQPAAPAAGADNAPTLEPQAAVPQAPLGGPATGSAPTGAPTHTT